MPRYREDISSLSPYEVGRPIEDVVREYGLDPDSIIKLAANESPEGPFPGVIEAASKTLISANRYPDNDLWDLSHALADELSIEPENLLFGNGSVALLAEITNAVGGPGANSVYGWPSFIMYRFAAIWSGTGYVEVPLDDTFSLDLEAIAAAINDETTLVIICNPNNPTGTVTPGDDIEAFIDAVPESVLVVVDEAYHEFVDDDRHRTAIPTAVTRANVLVLRTFSKIYGLAAQRIGYAVGQSSTLVELRKAQQPLTVNQVGQVAALASLGQPEEVRRRAEANSAARHHLMGVMAERGLPYAKSQTNFIFFRLGDDSRRGTEEFAKRGVIIRPMSEGWVRVTLGTPAENRMFVAVLDEVLDSTTD
ncbi:MAG: histidinol-phosphate transaminase [Acidimicrobiia bacterium]